MVVHLRHLHLRVGRSKTVVTRWVVVGTTMRLSRIWVAKGGIVKPRFKGVCSDIRGNRFPVWVLVKWIVIWSPRKWIPLRIRGVHVPRMRIHILRFAKNA